MSKKFVLPFIEPKQSKKEDFENYNFVKEGRKSRNSFKDTLPASSKEEDDLKQQIALLKKELDQRNNSVMALQRNFESLSTILKMEKSEAQRFKNELIANRELSNDQQQKIKNLELKLEDMGAKLALGKRDVEAAFEKTQGWNKLQNEYAKAKLREGELENLLEQRNGQNFDMSSKIKELNYQLGKYAEADKSVEKEKRKMMEEIEALKNENSLIKEQKLESETKMKILEDNLDKAVEKMGQLQRGSQEIDSLREEFNETEKKLKKEVAFLKNRESDLLIQLKKIENVHEAQQTLLKVKQNAEAAAKSEIATLKDNYKEIQAEVNALRLERGDCKCAKYAKVIASYEEIKEKAKDEVVFMARFELENNKATLKELRESVRFFSSENEQLRGKLEDEQRLKGEQIGEIQEQLREVEEKLEREKVKCEGMKNQFESIENQLKFWKGETMSLREEAKGLIVSMEGKENEREKIEKEAEFIARERAQMKKVLEEQVENICQLKATLQQNQVILEENQAKLRKNENELKRALQEKQELEKKINQYQLKTSELEKTLATERKIIEDLQGQQCQGESELDQMKARIQTEIINSQSLNSAHKQILATLQMKETDIQNLKQQLKEQTEMSQNNLKTFLDQSNSQQEALKVEVLKLQIEVKKLIAEKEAANRLDQCKDLKQHIQRTKQQLFFCWFDLKEKENSIFKLELDVKSLTSKLEKAFQDLEEMNPAKVKQQIKELQDKERLIRTSVAKIQNAAEAAEAQFGCNHCGKTITEAQTCAPCGHSYCEKCIKGYSPFCQECKKPDSTELIFHNKMLDQVIGNYNYIRLTLENIKVV